MSPAPVSSEHEELILVESNDEVVGYASKSECHDGAGRLHRAFSVFVLNEAGQVLLQRRHRSKRLWPQFWSNACCSHPRRGETRDEAARRRVSEELGLQVAPVYLYAFEYHAQFEQAGAEHELCAVYLARSSQPVRAHPDEIAEWRYIEPAALGPAMARDPHLYTPWLKLEWARLSREFPKEIGLG